MSHSQVTATLEALQKQEVTSEELKYMRINPLVAERIKQALKQTESDYLTTQQLKLLIATVSDDYWPNSVVIESQRPRTLTTISRSILKNFREETRSDNALSLAVWYSNQLLSERTLDLLSETIGVKVLIDVPVKTMEDVIRSIEEIDSIKKNLNSGSASRWMLVTTQRNFNGSPTSPDLGGRRVLRLDEALQVLLGEVAAANKVLEDCAYVCLAPETLSRKFNTASVSWSRESSKIKIWLYGMDQSVEQSLPWLTEFLH